MSAARKPTADKADETPAEETAPETPEASDAAPDVASDADGTEPAAEPETTTDYTVRAGGYRLVDGKGWVLDPELLAEQTAAAETAEDGD